MSQDDLAGKAPPQSVSNIKNLSSLTAKQSFHWTATTVHSAIKANIRFHEISLAPRIVMQTVCQPADRNMESLIDNSVIIASSIPRFISTRSNIERVCLIDDFHAANLIDYSLYLENLASVGYKPDHILFFSSPLVHEIAIDILNELLRLSEICDHFKILNKDGKLFFQVTDKAAAIEILENIEAQHLVRGVLFEAALSLLKRHHRVLLPLYASLHKLPENTDIHRCMLDYYTLTEASQRNRCFFSENPYLNVPSIKELFHQPFETHYLNAVRDPTLPPYPRSLLLNIVESVHRPQQAKLNQILEVLGEEPVHSIYFDASGNFEIESSRLQGPHTEEKKQISAKYRRPFRGDLEFF